MVYVAIHHVIPFLVADRRNQPPPPPPPKQQKKNTHTQHEKQTQDILDSENPISAGRGHRGVAGTPGQGRGQQKKKKKL